MARQDGPGSASEGHSSHGFSGGGGSLDAFGGAGADVSDIRSGARSASGQDLSFASSDGGSSPSGVVRDAAGNVRNPYPNSFFSRVFGADNVSYQNIMPQATLNRLGGMYEQRYNNPNMAVSRGFGKLFGGAEGEMTSAGPRVAGVRPQTLQEGIAGLAMGSIFPGAGMLEKAGRTLYAPEGMLPEGYEQEKGGLLESFLGGFGGLLQPEPSTVGREFDRLKGSAASLVDQAREGIRSLVPDAQADQMVDSVARPMESRADIRSRTGGRASTIPSPADEQKTRPYYGPSGPVGYGIGERPRVDLQTKPKPGSREATLAVLAGLDPNKSISSDQTYGVPDMVRSGALTPVALMGGEEYGPLSSEQLAGIAGSDIRGGSAKFIEEFQAGNPFYQVETETGDVFYNPSQRGQGIALGNVPELATNNQSGFNVPSFSFPNMSDIMEGLKNVGINPNRQRLGELGVRVR